MLNISQQYPSGCAQTDGFPSALLDPDQYTDLLAGNDHSPTYSGNVGTSSYGTYELNLNVKEGNSTPDLFSSSSALLSPKGTKDDIKSVRQPSYAEPDTTIKSPSPLHTVNHAAICEPNSAAKSDGSSWTTDDISPPSGAKKKGGKTAMKRTIYTQAQLAALERRFIQQSFLSREERQELAESLNITERQVMVWFQNRRGRLKKRGSADTAYNPLKLNELNTRRPYPFLYGMLSSMHYQTGSNSQQVWSMYPEDVKITASTALSERESGSSSKTSPGAHITSSPEGCLQKDEKVYNEDYPPNVVVNANGGTTRDSLSTGEQTQHLNSSPLMMNPVSGYPTSSGTIPYQDHQVSSCQKYAPSSGNMYPAYPQQQANYQGLYSGYQQSYHNKMGGNSYYCSRSASYSRPQQAVHCAPHVTTGSVQGAYGGDYWFQGENTSIPYNGYVNANIQPTHMRSANHASAPYTQQHGVSGQSE